eukprot:1854385-Prymnesium_polylepis.1
MMPDRVESETRERDDYTVTLYLTLSTNRQPGPDSRREAPPVDGTSRCTSHNYGAQQRTDRTRRVRAREL